MATNIRYAVATGNWSANSTWNGTASTPGTTDIVIANGFTVTVDTSPTVTQVQTLVPTGSGCTITLTTSTGAITNCALNAGGTAYPASATIWLNLTTGGTGGIVAVSTNGSGVVTSVTASPIAAGSGYSNGSSATTHTSASGGGFTLADSQTLTANVAAGTATCVTYAGNSPNSAAITGNVTGGSTTSAYGANATGTGTLNVTGAVAGGSGGTSSHGVYNSSTGTVNVTGAVTGGSSAQFGVYNGSTGTVNITGNCTGGGSGSFPSCYGVYNGSTGTVNITGNCTGGQYTQPNCHGVVNASTGAVNITGNCTGGAGSISYGVLNNNTGTVAIKGDCIAGTAFGCVGLYNNSTGRIHLEGNITGTATSTQQGTCGIATTNIAIYQTSTRQTSYAEAAGAMPGTPTGYSGALVAQYGALNTGSQSGHAAIADVRHGTVYGPTSNFTGLAYIPAAASVASGVNVDATTGTAVLTAAGVCAAIGLGSANLDTQLGGIQTGTTNIQTRIPAALTGGGNMKVDVLALNGNASAAANISLSAQTMYAGTVTSSPTTTTFVDSATSTYTEPDQFKGRIIIFYSAAHVIKEATNITAYNASTNQLTFTALSQSPTVGDAYIIV
jgi:hypothetical protein